MKKVLLVSARSYSPIDGGDKVVSVGLLNTLAGESDLYVYNILDSEDDLDGYKDTLDGTFHLKTVFDPFYSKAVSLLRSYVFHVPFFYGRRRNTRLRKRELSSYIKEIKPDILIWDHLRTSIYWTNNNAFNILLEHNNETEIYAQKVSRYNRVLQWILAPQVSGLRRITNEIHNRVNRIVYLNKVDIQQSAVGKSCILPQVIENFTQHPYILKTRREIKMLFIGSLDWYPNLEGLYWFLDEVMPRLTEDFSLTVIGRNPPSSLVERVAKMKRVAVFGNVKHTAPYFDDADIFISPVFVGSGVNIKILEAASHGMPIVLNSFSKKGYTGLDFFADSDTAADFETSILRLKSVEKRRDLAMKIEHWYNDYRQMRKESIKQAFLKI